MEATRDPRRAAAAPPDCLLLTPQGEVVGRFRSGSEPEQILRALHEALSAFPHLAPEVLTSTPEDSAAQRYQQGLERYRAGDIEDAWALWKALLAAHPEHPLRHRIAWHAQRPVFLPQHPDLGAMGQGPAPEVVVRPERAAIQVQMRGSPLYRWSPSGLPFAEIPAGTFTMGGSPAQKPSELPRRSVTLTRPYWMSAWPVTHALWARAFPEEGPEPEGPGGELPKTGLGLNEVARLCEALEAMDGWRYRLPTEAEWERAARGGIEGATYPWGNAPIDPARCNYAHPYPLPVGSYPPNDYGLFDMVGNCPEWTADYHLVDAYGLTPLEVRDPTGPPRDDARTPVTRVVRGGACQRSFMALLCRNSRRLAAPESPPPWMSIGARLVAEPPGEVRA